MSHVESESVCTALFGILWQMRRELETVSPLMKLMEAAGTHMWKWLKAYEPEQTYLLYNNNSERMLSTYDVSGTILCLQELREV